MLIDINSTVIKNLRLPIDKCIFNIYLRQSLKHSAMRIQRSKFFVWLLVANCLLPTANCFSQVVINEYSCSNVNSWVDNFGQYEDFIELYNTTAASVNINGYHLSDKKTNTLKWTFGNVTIPANGFLRVWASGRNTVAAGNNHANFKLTQCKPEAIVFADVAGVIIDSITLKPAQAGHSRGRTTNGAPTWSVFTTGTPGASNTSPQQEYATRPTMNVAAGFYAGAQSVTITSPDPNITIRYTTNGTTPVAASTAYSVPINISVTTVLRAKAFSSTAGIPASFVESNTYFIGAASAHTVEVLSVFGDQVGSLMGGNSGINPPSGLEYFDATGAFKTEGYGQTNKHGNDSWAYPQRGIDFVAMDQYGYSYALIHPIFNLKARTEYQRLIIKAAANDNYPFEGNPNSNFPGEFGGAHIRDQYVHTVSQKAGLHVDERTWAPAVMYVNGSYWGVYDSREKVDDDDFTNYYHNSDSQYATSPDQDSLQMLKTWGGTWSEYGGNTAQNEWDALSLFITSNNMAVQTNYDYADSLFSTKSLADYVILNSFCVTSDWLNWNTAWWRGKNVNANKKKWRYLLWDNDATFNHYINYTGIPNTDPNADPCDPQTLPDPGGQGHIPILNALLQNPGFKQYYVMRYFDLMNTSMTCNRLTTILDSMINVITPEMPAQIAKWGGSMSQWNANVLDLRNFILARCSLVVSGFAPCNGATGPYPIKLNVVPAGAGNVDVNSVNVTSFVWSATYPGGVNMNFTAHANSPYCFDYWEFQNHTPAPSINDTAVSINLIMTDSIIAHFTLSGSSPVITATDSSICPGDSTVLSVSSGSTFSWSPSTGLSCTTCANPVATPTAATTYTVFVTGACASGSGTITINMTSPGTPTVTASSPTICVGGTVTLSASGGSNFIWTPTAGLSCTTCPNPVASPTATTTYSVAVTGVCVNGTGATTITVGPAVPPTVTSVDASVCVGNSTTLSVNGGGGTYTWTPSATLSCSNCSNPVASPVTTTTYSVTVPMQNCVGGTGVVTVTVTQPPTPVKGNNPTICNTGSAELNVSGGSSYAWTPPTDLTCTLCPNPTASPSVTTVYYFTVSSGPNCSSLDSVIVFVTGECPDIYLPTGFSPNGDLNNDMLQVFGKLSEMHLVVYNRWGNIVFESSDQTIGWDGTHNGKIVESGVYAYKFFAIDTEGAAISKSGNITVVR